MAKNEEHVWTISKENDNHFIGKASDVVGEAKGMSAGNALNWKYDLNLPVDGKTYES